MYDPKTDVPSNEDEVFQTFAQWGTNLGTQGGILKDLFILYRKEGLSVIEAYEKCLVAAI